MCFVCFCLLLTLIIKSFVVFLQGVCLEVWRILLPTRTSRFELGIQGSNS